MKIKVFVLCKNASGEPIFHAVELEVTQAEYDNGEHYEKAIEDAEEEGYEPPFEAFDQNDPAAKELAGMARLMGFDPISDIRDDLNSVLEMAKCHLEDICSGLAEGIYEMKDNPDTEKQAISVEKVWHFLLNTKVTSATDKHYLLVMVGDIEPELHGPYDSDDEVIQAARNAREDDPEMENGLFRVYSRGGSVSIDSFAGIELDPREV
ncbi:hypothetical protein [Thiobacillus denitrificans]|uniref:hypothetical protein n=1 Tax=Thiobacillus denitrificans TaxID=36861 RepID=UPI00036D4487|nr:hypothetical protein [Thiobacillus denitrificans]